MPENEMTTAELEQKLVSALGVRDIDQFMRLVSPDIACLDGSDYETVKSKMNQLFAQVSALRASVHPYYRPQSAMSKAGWFR